MGKMINPEIFNLMLRSPTAHSLLDGGLIYELRIDGKERDIIVTSTNYTTLKEFINMTYGWGDELEEWVYHYSSGSEYTHIIMIDSCQDYVDSIDDNYEEEFIERFGYWPFELIYPNQTEPFRDW